MRDTGPTPCINEGRTHCDNRFYEICLWALQRIKSYVSPMTVGNQYMASSWMFARVANNSVPKLSRGQEARLVRIRARPLESNES